MLFGVSENTERLILRELRKTQQPLTEAEIAELMNAEVKSLEPQYVGLEGALQSLLQHGKIVRIGDDRYALPPGISDK